ncbi:MAG TPA: prolipoprotein diacylglyceryl transferase family protein [Myxococcaceae bacterium]|jgi:phosphatidylglycerol:prolipoprotein diacylglycerol transferase
MLALVLPYVELPDFHLFGLTIHPFGIFAALGVYTGAVLTVRAGRVYGPGDTKSLSEVFTWALVGGLLGAHLLHVLGYHPELLRTQGPLVLLKIWDGVSSMGGVLGGMAGIAIYFWRKRLRIYPYWDALALGTAPGWTVARMGCAVVHDHPGIRSNAWFAVAWPDGPRLDMGLIDCVLLLVISAVLYLLARKPRGQGALMGVLAVTYSVPRFFLDFFRATDLSFVDGRILGLTPAQWITPLLAALGVYLLVNARRMPLASTRPAPTAEGQAGEPPDRPKLLSASEAQAEEANRPHAPSAR